MSPALIQMLLVLIPALVQGIPAAIASSQALLSMLKSGTPPTDAQCAALTALFATDELAAKAAIDAAP